MDIPFFLTSTVVSFPFWLKGERGVSVLVRKEEKVGLDDTDVVAHIIRYLIVCTVTIRKIWEFPQ